MDYLIHHMLQSSARRRPDKEAMVHGERRVSYREVATRCAAVATGLRNAGMRRGDRVGIYLDPSIDQVLSIFSISQAGGVYVPINTVLFPEQVAHIVRDCGMKALITTPEKLEASCPSCRRFLRWSSTSSPEKPTAVATAMRSAKRKPVHRLEEMLRCRAPEAMGRLGNFQGPGSHPLHLRLDRQAQGRDVEPRQHHGRQHDRLDVPGASPMQERILAVLPFSFDAGMNQLMTAFQQGGTIVLIKFVFAKEIDHRAYSKSASPALAGVPTVWTLLTNGGLQKHSFPRFALHHQYRRRHATSGARSICVRRCRRRRYS